MTLAPASSLPVESATCLFCLEGATETIASGRDFEYDTSPDRFAMEQCRGCGLMFIVPRPAADAMSVIYPSNYYAYNEGESEVAFIKFFRDRIERAKVNRYREILKRSPETQADVLDIGCGDGRLLEILQRFGDPGWQLAGLELGEGAAAKAKAKGFEVRSGDFETLDIDGWQQRFDLALIHHVIEHTRDPRAVVRKIAGLLKPGGVVSIETPELAGWDYQLFRKRYWGGYHIPRHFYLFDRDTLARLLREEGFEVVSVRSILSPAFWIFSFHNYFVDRPGGLGRWLARFCHPQNLFAVGAATVAEIAQQLISGRSSNLQVLARRVAERSG